MSALDPGLAMYAAAAVALVVWLAIFGYLWSLDRRAREMRRLLDERARQPGQSAPAAPPTLRPLDNRERREQQETQNQV
jgi:CcmD family protein